VPPEQAHGRWPWCTLDWSDASLHPEHKPPRARFVCRRCHTERFTAAPATAGPALLAAFAIEHSACTEGCSPPSARPPPPATAPAVAPASGRGKRKLPALEPNEHELHLLAEGDRAGAVQAIRARTKCPLGDAHRLLNAIDPPAAAELLDEPASVAPGLTPEQFHQLAQVVEYAEGEWRAPSESVDLVTRAKRLSRYLHQLPVEDKADRLPAEFTAEGLGLEALDVHARARWLRETFEEFRPIRGQVVIYNWSAVMPRKRRLVPGVASVVPPNARRTWRGAGPAPWFRVDLSLFYWLACPHIEAQDRALHHLLMAFGVTDADPFAGEESEPCLMPFDIAEYRATVKRFGVDPPDVAFVEQCIEVAEPALRRAGVLWARPELEPSAPPAERRRTREREPETPREPGEDVL
jgi:hypothetical protein